MKDARHARRQPSARRQYAHRASRRRQPLLALAAGVVLLAVFVPVAWRALSDDSNNANDGSPRRTITQNQPSTPKTSAPSTSGPTSSRAPDTSGTTQPVSTPIPRTAPGVLIRIVPAVRDVEMTIDGTLYTSARDGTITLPDARGDVQVAFVGYSVVPALQKITFRSWSDGLTARNRALDADGRGHVSVAVDLQYRVTIDITGGTQGGARTLTATSPLGLLEFTDGTRRWVLAKRGEPSGTGFVVRTVDYSFDPANGSSSGGRQVFTPGPEALWVVRAP